MESEVRTVGHEIVGEHVELSAMRLIVSNFAHEAYSNSRSGLVKKKRPIHASR
jgi:hypothetical protein